ncbi:hypothetical protein WUBG_07781 [Wuchereria bancrofti]|uniref:Uncharacterized protein n=1 Tax=Wuchereria bancrofti TaxID=6293 RepID=J9EFR6_WUCBA|nr:hypothetical protein WUBG_07781 [Wuchereria bancrofti]
MSTVSSPSPDCRCIFRERDFPPSLGYVCMDELMLNYSSTYMIIARFMAVLPFKDNDNNNNNWKYCYYHLENCE